MSAHQNFLALGLCLFASCAFANTEYVQYGRYLTATYADSEANPLDVTVQREFPETIKTVGEALVFLLEGTGYSLASAEFTTPEARQLYQQTLPKSQQTLPPMTLEHALARLSGTPYQIIHDPVNRHISFKLRQAYQGWSHEYA